MRIENETASFMQTSLLSLVKELVEIPFRKRKKFLSFWNKVAKPENEMSGCSQQII